MQVSIGFMAGWNFFLYEACLIPWEISALNLVITFWTDKIPVWAICLICIILYGLINLVAVGIYGEAEFWLSSGKVLLIALVFSFTFVTMVGGNPQHDAYVFSSNLDEREIDFGVSRFGFRYWKNPGSFAEYITTGSLGRFEGFLAALYEAAFTIVGPEYLSMVAGETKYPRKYLKQAFK